MATIKAGTYRFNDVLTAPSRDYFGAYLTVPLNFTCSNILYAGTIVPTVNCTSLTFDYHWAEGDEIGTWSIGYFVSDVTAMFNVVYLYEDNSGCYWLTEELGEGIKTITIQADSEVSAEFAEWFSANAAPVVEHTVSGVWKFKDELTAEDGADIKQSVNFHYDLSGAGFGVDIDVRLYCSGFRVFWQSAYYDFNWLFVDIDRIEPSQVDVGGTTYDVATALGYTVPGDNPIHKERWSITVAPTIDFGTEPQTVSAEFYAWLTENATQPTATITYNGSTIATLNGGQTATLRCAGMNMESDVVVEIAEVSGSQEALDTELAEQENLIAELKETLANASSSGGGVIDLSKIPVVNSIDNPTEARPTAVRYNGEIYLLVEE